MGRSINSGIDMDDDELLAELEGLEQEVRALGLGVGVGVVRRR